MCIGVYYAFGYFKNRTEMRLEWQIHELGRNGTKPESTELQSLQQILYTLRSQNSVKHCADLTQKKIADLTLEGVSALTRLRSVSSQFALSVSN